MCTETQSARGDFVPSQYHENMVVLTPTNSDYSSYQQQLKPQYGPPGYEYPRPVYGAPVHQIYSGPVYGHTAPDNSGSQHVASAPREESWLDKFKLKFDLFTIGKILLKLVLFKKIVKFLAIICLLLFLPKFETEKEEEIPVEETRQYDIKRNIIL